MADADRLYQLCFDASWDKVNKVLEEPSTAEMAYNDPVELSSVLAIALFRHAPFEVIQKLLKNGISPNEPTRYGATALHLAV
jgi:hypothetical protein